MLWRRRSPPPEPRPVLEVFVLRVLEQLRNHRAPWQRHQPSRCRIWPERFLSRQPYAGVQGLHLLCWAAEHGYSDPRWGSRTRIQATGGRVPQDRTGVPVLPVHELDSPPPEGPPTPDGAEAGRVVLFNVDQAERLMLPELRDREIPYWAVADRVERLFQASGVGRLHDRGDRSFYQLGADRVVLPPRDRFGGAEFYYQTLLHELGHGTGHPDRLNRPVLLSAQQSGPDSLDAAREELRAEIGALMTGVRTGLGHRPRHGEIYTERWIQLIESDPRELVGAAADAWRMSESLLDGARKLEESRAEPSSGRPGVRETPRIRIRRGAPVPSSPPRPALGPPPPAPDAGVLKRFGWRGAEAEWIVLVCHHSGLFTRSQFCAYFHCRRNRALRFVRRLLRRGHGVQEDLDGLPTTTRPCRIHCPDLYRVLGLDNPRHRRTASPTVLFRRLLSLDYVLEHPDPPWLPTERAKIQALEALRIPRRRYYGRAQGQSRYFPLKLPLALDKAQATFVYCDPGRDSDQELLSWGAAHAWL